MFNLKTSRSLRRAARPVTQVSPPPRLPEVAAEDRLRNGVAIGVRHIADAIERYATAAGAEYPASRRGLFARNIALRALEDALTAAEARMEVVDRIDLDLTGRERREEFLIAVVMGRGVQELLDAAGDVAVERGQDPVAAVDQMAEAVRSYTAERARVWREDV